MVFVAQSGQKFPANGHHVRRTVIDIGHDPLFGAFVSKGTMAASVASTGSEITTESAHCSLRCPLVGFERKKPGTAMKK